MNKSNDAHRCALRRRSPVRISMPGGRYFNSVSMDMSVGGAAIKVPSDAHFVPGDLLAVSFPSTGEDDTLRAHVIGTVGETLRIAFRLDTIAEQEILTRALYSRADAWLETGKPKEVDRPLISLGRVMVLSTYGIYQVLRSLFPERKAPKRVVRVKTAAIMLAATLALCSRGFATEAPGSAPQVVGAEASEATDSSRDANAGNSGGDSAHVVSLKDMGVNSAIDMHGPHSYSALHFTLPHQLAPQQGLLHLNYNIDANLDPASTDLRVSLNGTLIGTIHPSQDSRGERRLATIALPISPLMLVRSNTLTFEFVGSSVMEREEQARQHVLCRIFNSSGIEVSGDWLRMGKDLSQLPLPLLDSELQTTTSIPFVILNSPTPGVLQSAGIVASWFGTMSRIQAGALHCFFWRDSHRKRGRVL